MPIDPALNPTTPQDPQARMAQKLAFVAAREPKPPPRVVIPHTARTVTNTGGNLGSATINLPGDTSSLAAATSCMVNFYTRVTISNVVSGPVIGWFGISCFNQLWSFYTEGGLILADAMPTGAAARTYVTAPGQRAAETGSSAFPMGGWVSMPVVAGPTTFTVTVASGTGAGTFDIVSGFTSIRVDP